MFFTCKLDFCILKALAEGPSEDKRESEEKNDGRSATDEVLMGFMN